MAYYWDLTIFAEITAPMYDTNSAEIFVSLGVK